MSATKKPISNKIASDAERGARHKIIEELFYDFYKSRISIYWMNFMRGVFFGFGSIVGATIVVAIFIWVMSLFTDIPGIGDFFESISRSVESSN